MILTIFLLQLKLIFNLGLYTSPLYFSYVLRRVDSYRQNPRSFGELCFCISCFYAAGYFLRAAGRLVNPAYMEFNQVLRTSTRSAEFSGTNKAALSRYDLDFWAWPVEFQMRSLVG